MLSLKLAYRNLLGAGLRTWLNVGVLSLIYVLIIWHQGLFEGMLRQASQFTIKDEIAGGQFWVRQYDPYDPMAIDDSHGPLPDRLREMIQGQEATAILIRGAFIFPHGRMQNVLLKGIDPGQKILGIPTSALQTKESILPVLVGKIMAEDNDFKKGDLITIRWRDSHGTFDALEGRIVEIMGTDVPNIDRGQLWIPLPALQKMTRLEGEATMVVVDQKVRKPGEVDGWIFRDHEYLLKDIRDIVKTKRISSLILYVILLFLAMLAVFDTQVLSIFRRRREIGTLMALGMTRNQVISLFTVEGMMNGILALGAGALYGVPLLYLTAKRGIPLPEITKEYGYALATRLIPAYSAGLVLGTVLIVMLTVIIVSYLPARDISKMKPTEALKGKTT